MEPQRGEVIGGKLEHEIVWKPIAILFHRLVAEEADILLTKLGKPT